MISTSLGTLTATGLLTFDQVPFSITLQAPDRHREHGGDAPWNPRTEVDGSIRIEGRLNGQISGPTTFMSLRGTIDSMRLSAHQTSRSATFKSMNFRSHFKISKRPPRSPWRRPPAGSPQTRTFVSDPIVITAVPEPATVWVFAAGLGMVGRWRRAA